MQQKMKCKYYTSMLNAFEKRRFAICLHYMHLHLVRRYLHNQSCRVIDNMICLFTKKYRQMRLLEKSEITFFTLKIGYVYQGRCNILSTNVFNHIVKE